jgi:nitroreductase
MSIPETSIAEFDLATVDRLLSTTRAVRRRLDLARPVERSVILDCIRLSQQAPTASNSQTWRWLIVTDETKRKQLAEIYLRNMPIVQAQLARIPDSEDQTRRAYEGAIWLAERLEQVPALVLPCVEGRPPEQFSNVVSSALYGSIMPAVWSFQLALRSRGLGSCFTTVHLFYEDEVRQLFGIPENVLQVALLPVAYTRGTDFKPARRDAAETITYWDAWGAGD